MSSPELSVEYDESVLILTMDRPRQRNAMNVAMAEQLAGAMDEFDARPDLSVAVLTGAGGAFCSGMDLNAFLAGEVVSLPGRGFGGLTERPPAKPLIAAVEGSAIGGGLELMLTCDLVVAAEEARFGLPEVRRGLVARAGGLLRLPDRLPRNVAMEMILTGEHIDGSRAADLGLVNHVVASNGALEFAITLAKKIAANAPLAVRVSKEIVSQYSSWPLDERFDRQRVLTEPVFASADAIEGARAFGEKRTPRWTGA